MSREVVAWMSRCALLVDFVANVWYQWDGPDAFVAVLASCCP